MAVPAETASAPAGRGSVARAPVAAVLSVACSATTGAVGLSGSAAFQVSWVRKMLLVDSIVAIAELQTGECLVEPDVCSCLKSAEHSGQAVN